MGIIQRRRTCLRLNVFIYTTAVAFPAAGLQHLNQPVTVTGTTFTVKPHACRGLSADVLDRDPSQHGLRYARRWGWTDRTVHPTIPQPGKPGGLRSLSDLGAKAAVCVPTAGVLTRFTALTGTTGGGACTLSPWNIVANYPLFRISFRASDGTFAYGAGGFAGGSPSNSFKHV